MLTDTMLFAPLPSPEEMAEWDRLAESEYGVPTLLLMENAAREALHVFKELHGIEPGLPVLVLAGGGNNGGDGIAMARHLHNAGCSVQVCTLKPHSAYSGIALAHYDMAVKAGVPVQEAILPPHSASNLPERPAIIIDALLGAGFHGPLRGDVLNLVQYINSRAGAYVLSLDIPSGLGAVNGRPDPEAVRASATVTFAAPKPGLCLPWAKDYTGRLKVREIGIPVALMRKRPPERRLVCPQEGILQKTAHYAHKGQKGQVLVIGGSHGLSGAPVLSALGAARSGVGLITVATPQSLCRDVMREHPELMTMPLNGANWDEFVETPDFNKFLATIEALPHNSAIVLGPGIGQEKGVIKLLRAVTGMKKRPPLVLDADGLRPFRAVDTAKLTPEEELEFLPLSLLKDTDVITPHPGEMARLLSGTASVLPVANPVSAKPFSSRDMLEQEGREAALGAAVAHTNAAVLLKGAGTLVQKQGTPVSVISFAEPNLAVGGSGDTLCGIIAALMARSPMPDFTSDMAAALGAYIHGRAGVICARKFPAGGNLAVDIAEAVPEALLELVKID